MTGHRDAPRIAFVVSHTHWDREWYRTSHQFRVKLVDVVREVLDALELDGAFNHFLLDGQVVLLQDYLAFCPDDAGRIRSLVERGKLAVGPWYVLPDEFLVSAEAHVRNLLVGRSVAALFGPVQRVGYMPDSFGHIAQMPQILRGAGLDAFVYSRGDDDTIDELGAEYRWVAPDGSEVLAIHQVGGYCRGAALGYEESWEAHTQREPNIALAVDQVRELFAEVAGRSNGDIVLVSNGCDHLAPQARLGAILEALRRAFPETSIRHASLAAYVEEVRASGIAEKTRTGELLGSRHQFILSGVWSTRMYLKQQNDAAQAALSSYLEPVSAYVHFMHGQRYPDGAIDYAWQLLLRSHPHDSICGCSVDEVHREMESRLAGVIQTTEELLSGQLVGLVPTFARRAADDAETVLCVMNPLAVERREVINRLVVLQPPGIDPQRLELIDEAGDAVPCMVVGSEQVERFWGVDYRTTLYGERQETLFEQYRKTFGRRILRDSAEPGTSDQFVTIQFQAELPALGHAVYRLRERDEPTDLPRSASLVSADDSLENELVRITLHPDGTFDLVDKATGAPYSGLNRLTDTEDVGDEYDYSAAAVSATVTADGVEGDVRIVGDTGLRAAIEAEFALELPAEIAPDRKERSRRSVTCRVCVRLEITRDSPLVDVEVVFENGAKDHRLRAEFPTAIRTAEIISDGHFLLNHRPVEFVEREDWLQPPSYTYPQQDFSLVQDGRYGLAILNRGLPEVAPLTTSTEGVGMALTLLRAVGWLSRDDFPTRRQQNAGPMLSTPDAQCPGEQRFHYAVVPFAGDCVTSDIKGVSDRWRTPPLCVQGVQDRHVAGGRGLVRHAGSGAYITAVKQHQIRDTLVIRLYNLTGEPVDERVEFGRDVDQVWRTNLLEDREAELQAGEASVIVPLRPHEIVTIEVQFAG